jgi:RNA polymerase sigma-70 factor (ECF subfamily)
METGGAVAAQLKMSENTFKSHLHRLRKRYRDLLREVIADTVVSPQQVEDELQALSAAFQDA